MELYLIIATVNRPEMLRNILLFLKNQSVLPAKVFVVGTKIQDFPSDYIKVDYEEFLVGPSGLTKQRNLGMKKALEKNADIISFIDDDFLPHQDYFKNLLHSFSRHTDVSMIHGDVIADGRSSQGYSFDQGLEILLRHNILQGEANITKSAYGCNMSVRANLVGTSQFDENLPLYAWLEDLDFSVEMSRKGKIIKDFSLIGVHLSEKKGRIKEIKYGYSQIINPIYLYRKKNLSFLDCVSLVIKPMLANMLKFYIPEPWVDRKGRLKGNMIAVWHLAKGKIDPSYILYL